MAITQETLFHEIEGKCEVEKRCRLNILKVVGGNVVAKAWNCFYIIDSNILISCAQKILVPLLNPNEKNLHPPQTDGPTLPIIN